VPASFVPEEAIQELRSRRGPQKAICAVASILTAIWHMLKTGSPHRDIGAGYFDRRSPDRKLNT
jgi:hypothetical protein